MAEFTVRPIAAEEKEEWDAFVAESAQSTVFHYYDWLRCAEEESGYRLEALKVEQNGDRFAGIFPLFVKRNKGINLVVSPPPGCAIPHLGPLFHFKSENQYCIESEYRKLVSTLSYYIKHKLRADYQRFTLPPSVIDVRPFIWDGYDASPLYTYKLNLEVTEEELLADFDKRIRSRVKKFQKKYNHTEMRTEGFSEIVDAVKSRYQQKGRKHETSKTYFQQLIESLTSNIRAYSIYDGDHYISGILTLHHQNMVQVWIGGTNPDKKYDGVNEFLHWSLIQKLKKDGVKWYERIGANTPHLCENKSKYNFRPVQYYKLEKKNRKARVAEYIAQKIGIRGSDI